MLVSNIFSSWQALLSGFGRGRGTAADCAVETAGDARDEIGDAARQEDPVAVEVYHRFIGYLAQAVASVVNLIDPEVIVLGGGVSKAGSFLLKPLVREFPRYVLFDDQPLPEIKLAVLGSEAGIIGAAMLT